VDPGSTGEISLTRVFGLMTPSSPAVASGIMLPVYQSKKLVPLFGPISGTLGLNSVTPNLFLNSPLFVNAALYMPISNESYVAPKPT
jgi:hypothetical protein